MDQRAEREKASRSRFRQAGLQPDTVATTLDEVRRSLGGPADAETFTRDALSTDDGANSADTADGFTARIDTVPAARPRPAAAGQGRSGCTSTARCPSRPGTACSPAPTPRSMRCRATSSTPRSTPTSTRGCDRPAAPG